MSKHSKIIVIPIYNEEKRLKFNRFEESLVELYSRRFKTLDKMDAAITAGNMRRDITSMSEPLEVEMGASQFTVIEDRDGHIPLVRNKKVDQFINYFQKMIEIEEGFNINVAYDGDRIQPVYSLINCDLINSNNLAIQVPIL